MRKIEHILFLAFVTIALLLTNSGCASPLIAKAEALADVEDLQREVQLLNLLNDLELRASQMRFIMESAARTPHSVLQTFYKTTIRP